MDECVSDWSELPPELLEMIVVRLVSMKNVVKFRGVCTSWRAAAKKDIFPAVSKIPLLMLAEKDDSGKRKLYSFSGKKICGSISFPEGKGKRCMDVGFGWILTLPSFGGKVSLVKPFTGAKIDLPGYESLPRDNKGTLVPEYYYIRRAILSEDPTDGTSDFDLVVLAHGLKWLGLGLAFWRQRDKTWRRVRDEMFYPMEPSHIQLGDYSNFGRYKHKLYAIDHWGANLWEWDPRTCCFVKISVVVGRCLNYMPYLVESSNGDLLLILRVANKEVYDYWAHTSFWVYRIDVTNQTQYHIESMGTDAVFVGDNVSVSVSADEFPAGVIKPNCIYFTDDCASWLEREWEKNDPNKVAYEGGGKSMGVFNYGDFSTTRFKFDFAASIFSWPVCNRSSRSEVKSLSNKCPPLWIFPWC